MHRTNALSLSSCALFLLALISQAGHAAAPYDIIWKRLLGTPDADSLESVAVDSWGNIFTGGHTRGSVTGTNAGGIDALIMKYDAAGQLLWSRQFGTAADDLVHSITSDAAGNVYLSGSTGGNLGGMTAGKNDAFLTKYDAFGGFVWSRQVGTAANDFGRGLAVDADDNIYATGYVADIPMKNDWDAFLNKFDHFGNLIWSQPITFFADYDRGTSVDIDSAGNILVGGDTGSHTFLTKFDPLGNKLFARKSGQAKTDILTSMVVDSDNNMYTTGWIENGPASNPNFDAFLAKYNSEGINLWYKFVDTQNFDFGSGVDVDAAGNVYLAGYTGGSFDSFQAGGIDAFLQKYGPLGDLLVSRQVGTGLDNFVSGLAIDINRNAYVTGQDISIRSQTGRDAEAFLIKFVVPEPATVCLIALGALFFAAHRVQRH